MKRCFFFIVLALEVLAGTMTASAQTQEQDVRLDFRNNLGVALMGGPKMMTDLSDIRYEILENYLLDKFTGKLMYLYFNNNRGERIVIDRVGGPRELSEAEADHARFQFGRIEAIGQYILFDVDGGDVWFLRNPGRRAELRYMFLSD